MFKSKTEIKSLRRHVDRLNKEIYGLVPHVGIKDDLKYMMKRQNRLERKLDMLMDYLGVEEKNEPEKHYIDRRDDE